MVLGVGMAQLVWHLVSTDFSLPHCCCNGPNGGSSTYPSCLYILSCIHPILRMNSDSLVPVRLDGRFRIKDLLRTGSFSML